LFQSKFPVYLAFSQSERQHYVVKAYPYANGKIDPYFFRELPISSLSHPNLLQYIEGASSKRGLLNNPETQYSYILMEFAPFGDFVDIFAKMRTMKNERVARTYFHHLVDGLEYLHAKGYAHMDLKLDNLLLGENFVLKIADFDCSYFENEKVTLQRGTRGYRAPEVKYSRCNNPKAADIYSAGIILFMLTSGFAPYLEGECVSGYDLFELLITDQKKYWDALKKIRNSRFDKDFKKLFEAMTDPSAEKRISIKEIKRNKWYKGPIYSQQELKSIMEQNVQPTSINEIPVA